LLVPARVADGKTVPASSATRNPISPASFDLNPNTKQVAYLSQKKNTSWLTIFSIRSDGEELKKACAPEAGKI
jgi:hypothetical protein